MDKSDSTPPKSPKDKTQQSVTRAVYISILAIIIALIAIGFAVYAWDQYINVQTGSDDKTQRLYQQHATTQTNIQQLQQNIAINQKNLAATQQNVAELMHSINLSKQQNMLSQVAYLVNLANLQLSVSHNSQMALHLLKLAHAKVEALNDPALFTLNKSLIKDINALNKVPNVDVAAIVVKIDQINSDIQRTSIPPSEKDLTKSISEQTNAQPDTSDKHAKWYQRAWSKMSGVKDLVIIRKQQNVSYPLMSGDQQVNLKANIETKLLQAESAAIQHNNKLYQQHLKIVSQWINEYFHASKDKDSILTQLKDLQNINVNPDIPDISDSLSAISEDLSRSYQTNSQPKTNNENQTKITTPQKNTDQNTQQSKPTSPDLKQLENNNKGVAI